MEVKEKLIVALDYDSLDEVENLWQELKGQVGYYKIGLQLFTMNGPNAIRFFKERGEKVFADLKLHDIPNTVAQATKVLTSLGADIIDLHVSGGVEMMKAAVKAAAEAAEKDQIKRPAVIGVTVLTSLDEKGLGEMGLPNSDINKLVVDWARIAQEAGLDGVVASPLEAKGIREACGPDFMIVTPGIRPHATATHDQKRINTPQEALKAGASHLVIGRAITEAQIPREAVKNILLEMEG
ncbi:MAG: orotidine-5'-phosphate decarboxylase [Bacillota bacterium]